MTLRMILGFLLALTPLPGLCLNPIPLTQTNFIERPKLGLSDEYLQLAAADNLNTETSFSKTDTFDPVFEQD